MTTTKTSKEKVAADVQDFISNATSLFSGLKKMADERMGEMKKDIRRRGMWDEERGKKLVGDIVKETEKYIERTAKDLKSMAAKVAESSPVVTKEDLKKMFATKEDLKSMEERLAQSMRRHAKK